MCSFRAGRHRIKVRSLCTRYATYTLPTRAHSAYATKVVNRTRTQRKRNITFIPIFEFIDDNLRKYVLSGHCCRYNYYIMLLSAADRLNTYYIYMCAFITTWYESKIKAPSLKRYNWRVRNCLSTKYKSYIYQRYKTIKMLLWWYYVLEFLLMNVHHNYCERPTRANWKPSQMAVEQNQLDRQNNNNSLIFNTVHAHAGFNVVSPSPVFND